MIDFAPAARILLVLTHTRAIHIRLRPSRISKYNPIAISNNPPSGRSKIAPAIATPQPNQGHIPSDDINPAIAKSKSKAVKKISKVSVSAAAE